MPDTTRVYDWLPGARASAYEDAALGAEAAWRVKYYPVYDWRVFVLEEMRLIANES